MECSIRLSQELTRNAFTIAYADDLASVISADNDEALIENTYTCLAQIGEWSSKQEMDRKNTQAVIIKLRRRSEHVRFSLEGVDVIPKRSVVYLGITVNEKMKFEQHVGAAITPKQRPG